MYSFSFELMWVMIWPPGGVGDTIFGLGVFGGDGSGDNSPNYLLAKLELRCYTYNAIFLIRRCLIRHN